MFRVIAMMFCFVMAGLNVWAIAALHGGPMNYVATAVTLGAGFYTLASLVKNP